MATGTNGWIVPYGTHTYAGASAVLTVRSSSVCPSDSTSANYATGNLGNFVYAYTMVATADASAWSQSGYFRSYGTPLIHMAQQKWPDGSLHDNFCLICGTLSAGETHKYWQQASPGGGDCACMHANVDQTQFIVSPTNSLSSWLLAGPLSPQFDGETRYRESDMPGSSSQSALFTQMSVQSRYDFVFGPAPCFSATDLTAGNDNVARWASAAVSCTNPTAGRIWTK